MNSINRSCPRAPLHRSMSWSISAALSLGCLSARPLHDAGQKSSTERPRNHRYGLMTSRIAANWLSVISLFFAGMSLAAEQDYAARFKELREQKADAQIEPLLNEWREKEPNDPDAWITSANYYFNQRQVMISTKKPDKGDFSLTDAKTGKPAGSISFEQDKTAAKHAADILQEATTKFPDRLDIWCGLAFIQQESGSFDAELATLKNMVGYARDHSTQVKWLKGEELPEPPDQFIAEKLHSYGLYYEKKENPEDDKR